MSAGLGTAGADEVLVFQRQTNDPVGGDTAGGEVATVLEGLGHQVTLMASMSPQLPADLSAFDAVWVIQLSPLTAGERVILGDYVRGGGGLYLTGERVCCETLNGSIELLVNGLLVDAIQVGGLGDAGSTFTVNSSVVCGVATDPNPLTTFLAGDAGALGQVPAENVFAESASGAVVGAVFPPEALYQAGGCVAIVMDLSLWMDGNQPTQDRAVIAENFETFLFDCGDADGDGISDETEVQIGTDPADPDTDDDGLCDGYGAVSGTCIPGDGATEDTDGDGTIDPLEPDDDDDGIPTSEEIAAEQMYPDVDGDATPAWKDINSDGDFVLDEIEGIGDYDNDGVPAFIDADDTPPPCQEDADCGGPTSGRVCDTEVFFCTDGCRGQGGNGCPGGFVCTSMDDTIGDCVPGGEGGGGVGGAGPATSSATGGPGSTSGAGPGATTAGSGGAGADGGGGGGDGDGCDCRTEGGPRAAGGLGALLLLAAAALVRRRGPR